MLVELGAHGQDELIVTYVVDAGGQLRLADRASEHVACAGGGPVLTAGELAVDIASLSIEYASNQSTGFCPASSSFAPLGRALDSAGIEHLGEFTASFEFRRCEACLERTLVKESVFFCVECGAALREQWNFERAYVTRQHLSDFVVDTIEEAASSDEDRVAMQHSDEGLTIVLADGAGGTSGGRQAAERTVDLLGAAKLQTTDQARQALSGLDLMLASGHAGGDGRAGETTAVLVRMTKEGDVLGASVGDSVCFARSGARWFELSAEQKRKPLIGSGRAQPVTFGPLTNVDVLLVASDGLAKYVDHAKLLTAIEEGGAELSFELADMARLPSGELRDDLSSVLVRRQ